MIKEGDHLWLYRPRVLNNYQGLSAIALHIHSKKSLLYMHYSFFGIMYEPRQYCYYKVRSGKV